MRAETHDSHGQHHLAAVFYHMQAIRLRIHDSTELRLLLYADGSGTVTYAGTALNFGSIEMAANIMQQIDEKGFVS